jgi:GTP-binding nuclear protein Ran
MYADSKIPTYKIAIVGDKKVGKTSFVKRHKTGEFEQKYSASDELEVTELTFFTNRGPISFQLFTVPPSNYFSDGFLLGADAAILMFDLSNRESYLNIPNYHKSIKRVCNEIPVVMCGNKRDEKIIKDKLIVYHLKKNLKYCEISTKTNYNFESPFLEIAKLLANDADLSFVYEVTMPMPCLEIDEETMKRFELEIMQAKNMILPDYEEDF